MDEPRVPPDQAVEAFRQDAKAEYWFVDTLLKWHQMRYYSRMRDIEVSSFHLNHLTVGGLELPC